MRSAITLTSILVFACTEPPPREPVSTTPKSTATVVTSPPTQEKSPKIPKLLQTQKKSALDRMRAPIRRRHYNRQKNITPPPAMSPVVLSLIPKALAGKTTGFEIHQNMKLVKPAAGRRFYRLRWITLSRGKTLRHGILKALRRGGWAIVGSLIPKEIEQNDLGRLKITIKEPAERPSEIDLGLEAPASSDSIHNPSNWFSRTAPWMKTLGSTPLVGFEFSRFHGVHFGASFTDIERAALGYRPAAPETFRRAFFARAKANGFREHPKKPHRLRHADGSSLVFTDGGAGILVLHAQNRWGHPKAAFDKLGPKK